MKSSLFFESEYQYDNKCTRLHFTQPAKKYQDSPTARRFSGTDTLNLIEGPPDLAIGEHLEKDRRSRQRLGENTQDNATFR